MESLRGPEIRRKRLDEGTVHVFALTDYAEAMRKEREYTQHGHTGVILIKTSELRVVLEVAEAGKGMAEHVIRGPATVQILEGSLEFSTRNASFTARAGDMAVLPHDEPRTVTAKEKTTFLLALALAP